MAVVKKIINNKLLLRMWRKMALLCTDAGNINWFSHYGKEYEGSFLKKKKKKKIGLLLFDPAVSLLGIFPKKTNTNLKQYMGMTQRDGMGRVVGGGKKKRQEKKNPIYAPLCSLQYYLL